MPSTAIVQSPQPEWIARWGWPILAAVDATGTGGGVNDHSGWRPNIQISSASAAFNPLVTATGALTLQVRNGRACSRSNANPTAFIAQFPPWMPNFGPASGISPGCRVTEASVVAVWDIMFSLTSPLAVYTADTTGWWWVPPVTAAGIAPNAQNSPPGGAAPSGGFGICVNNDGGGNARLEFLCFLGAVVALRTPAPAGSVPDITDWNNVRVMIVTAAAGREAFVSVWVNGTDWIDTRRFDDVTLSRPNTIINRALNFGLDFVQAGSVSAIFQSIEAKFGRMTPLGISYQDE